MKILVKILGAVVAVIVLAVAGLAIFVSTMDVDSYRGQIASELSQQTGRTVKLDGKLGVGLGMHGATLSIQNVSISNPAWASRPELSKIGEFRLGVQLLPLLQHKIVVSQLLIDKADILLESGKDGQNNWTLAPAASTTATSAVKPEASGKVEQGKAVKSAPTLSGGALQISTLSITNSHVGMRDATGKMQAAVIDSITLAMQSAGAMIDAKVSLDNKPITLALKTGITNLLDAQKFPFDADIGYDKLKLSAKGTADLAAKSAKLDSYKLSSGASSFGGTLTANWGGARPSLHGEINSSHFDPKDFAVSDANGSSSTTATVPGATAPAPASTSKTTSKSTPMFSSDPLPFDGLKSADAHLSVAIEEIPLDSISLKKLAMKIDLVGGRLDISQLTGMLNTAKIDGHIALDASMTPAHQGIKLTLNGLQLADLSKIAHADNLAKGAVNADIDVRSAGTSPHAIAANMAGTMSLIADKGEISATAASAISPGLAQILVPRGGLAAMNCMATRFTLNNGVAHDNGMLIDTAPTTVMGKGGFDLGSETIDLTLMPRAKIKGIGNVIPPMKISGSLGDPGFALSAGDIVSGIAGLLQGGKFAMGNSVPDVSGPDGQNACVYTLDHPQAASSSGASSTGDMKLPKLKDIGSSLKGLLGQ